MSDEFRAGASSVNVSPDNPELLTVMDMGRTGLPAKVLKSNEMFADAVAFEAGGELLIITTFDARTDGKGGSTANKQYVRHAIAKRTGCKATHLRILDHHNHSSWATPVDPNDPKSRRAQQDYRKKVRQGTIDACCQAIESLRPAEIATATATLTETVGTNRRMRYSCGGVCPSWAAGPIAIGGEKFVGPTESDSKRITFLCARAVGETDPFVILTCYGSHIHLTNLPYFSAEFIGGVRNAFAKRLPAATIVYGLGFTGDVDMHSTYPIGSDDHDQWVAWFHKSVETLGERFVKAVMAAMPTDGYTRPNEMKYVEYSTLDQRHDRRKRAYAIRGFRMGKIAIVTTPSEMFSAFAEQIHAASPFKNLLLLTFDSPWLGYMGTPIAYEQGGYEIKHQGYSPEIEAAMIASGKQSRKIGLTRPDTGTEVTANIINLLKDLAD